MLNIKKYTNGRYFDIDAKSYINKDKLAEIIQKGENIKVILAKTGKDITDTVIAQFAKKDEEEKESKDKRKLEIPFVKTEKMAKWFGEIIDAKIEKVMKVINLPSREQVARLEENIKELNKKIDALKLSQEKPASTAKKQVKAKAEAKKSKQSEVSEILEAAS